MCAVFICLQALIDDLERRQVAIQSTKEAVSRALGEENPENREECT